MHSVYVTMEDYVDLIITSIYHVNLLT